MIVFLITDTRVGSTALGHALCGNERYHFLGEILYPDMETVREDHLYRRLIDVTIEDLRDRNGIFVRLDTFFLPYHASDQVYIVDIKYHDFSILSSHPATMLARPLILSYILERDFHVLHLNRRNKMMAALSQEVAAQGMAHHSFDGQLARHTVDTLGLYDLVSSSLQRQFVHAQVRRWLLGSGKVIDVEYEALFDEVDGLSILREFIAAKWRINDLVIRPVTARVRDKVVIADAIAAELLQVTRGTTWEQDAEEVIRNYTDRLA